MIFEEFKTWVLQAFAQNLPTLAVDDEKIHKLFLLTEHMLEVNKSMNLTAIKDEKAVIFRHYVDSLLVCNFFKPNSEIIDVGCGAGFPTLPLALFRPDLQITALDGTAKRIEYVKQTAALLELGNVTAISGRAEELAHASDYREKFDYATARAVAALPILSELCLPFVKVGGEFIAMKASKADEELTASQNSICKCGGAVKAFEWRELKENREISDSRAIIVVSKIANTPKDLPRHYSKISKKPL